MSDRTSECLQNERLFTAKGKMNANERIKGIFSFSDELTNAVGEVSFYPSPLRRTTFIYKVMRTCRPQLYTRHFASILECWQRGRPGDVMILSIMTRRFHREALSDVFWVPKRKYLSITISWSSSTDWVWQRCWEADLTFDPRIRVSALATRTRIDLSYWVQGT